ncbi:MAG TPA: ATP-binding cassette domain-containing protein, partial [Spirochaetia bacterium]|nr:ATP-binding cassette domain-containing protein [Spirochaetia bacterium]
MDELIRMEKIEILSEGFEIIKNMTLNFPRGMSTVIIGPSGCGKSTLLKAAAGILLPSRGSLFFEGKNFFKMSEEEIKEFRRKNGFVFQDSALWANRSLYQNLSLPLEFHYPDWSEEKRSSKIRILL